MMSIDRIFKQLLITLYRWIINKYDKFTADLIECSIADIILQRGDVVNENQLLLTSRLCDVEDYCDRELTTFFHQNTISRKIYGANHKEDRGNKSFAALIESYKKDGYNPSSIVTVDPDITLIDGTHRMGLHLYEKIEKVNVRRVHRKLPWMYGVDRFYILGLDTWFLEKLHVRYQEIQQWLTESGNTFCAIVQGSASKTFDVIKDFNRLCSVLKYSKLSGGGYLLQFSMPEPQYTVRNHKLVSLRACEIEKLLRKRYGPETKVLVSNNCLEGKVLFESYNKIR